MQDIAQASKSFKGIAKLPDNSQKRPGTAFLVFYSSNALPPPRPTTRHISPLGKSLKSLALLHRQRSYIQVGS